MNKEVEPLSKAIEDQIVGYINYRRTHNVTHLGMAEREHSIWAAIKKQYGKGVTQAVGERRDWFRARFIGIFEDALSTYEARAFMYNAGAWAHTLFELIDQNQIALKLASTPVSKASKLIRDACVEPTTALGRVMNVSGMETTAKRKPARAKKCKKEDTVVFDGSANGNSRKLNLHIRDLASVFLEATFKDVYIDKYHVDRLKVDFNDSVDLLLEDFGKKVTKVKSGTRDDGMNEISRTDFRWACEVFGTTYEWGGHVNMRSIKKRKNQRVLDLHPDRNQSNTAAAEAEMKSVLDAFELLENYTSKNNRR